MVAADITYKMSEDASKNLSMFLKENTVVIRVTMIYLSLPHSIIACVSHCDHKLLPLHNLPGQYVISSPILNHYSEIYSWWPQWTIWGTRTQIHSGICRTNTVLIVLSLWPLNYESFSLRSLWSGRRINT